MREITGTLEHKLKKEGLNDFQVKKGGTAEADLSSLISRDEGFFYCIFYSIMEG
ncbi:MAG: hypothetical protein GX301_07825 [Gracilibacteraceae bacterium]|nr:hypothetical protein [Gracilibacteraceae bacterium]